MKIPCTSELKTTLIITIGFLRTQNSQTIGFKDKEELDIRTLFNQWIEEEVCHEYEWDKCKLLSNWTNKTKFLSLPKFLIIQLMRFKSNQDVAEANLPYYAYAEPDDYTKKDDFVNYPIKDLDLTNYFSKEQRPKNCKYNLYGVK